MQDATKRSIEAISAVQCTIRAIGSEQGAVTLEIVRSVDLAAKQIFETATEVG